MIVDGVGNMLVGDFRQPLLAKKAVVNEGDMAAPVQDVQRPSASAFRVAEADDAHAARRRRVGMVQLEGDVVLVHRSGLQLELTDEQKKQWSVADWHDLRPGRHIVLGCGTLQAAFDKPAEGKKALRRPDSAGHRVATCETSRPSRT